MKAGRWFSGGFYPTCSQISVRLNICTCFADEEGVDLSIVLPAYNEEARIETMLEQLAKYQAMSNLNVEVVVVDDGSKDRTGALVKSWENQIEHLLLVRQPENMGKGRAVATGMLTARGQYRAFFDADGATPVIEVDKLLEAIKANPRSVAIGSLGKYGNRDLREPQPLSRTVAGRLGNAYIQRTVLPGVDDSQRGAKLWPAELADAVFRMQRLSGWGFDIEVLALSQKLGYSIVEVPITWKHIAGGHIGPAAYFRTLKEVRRVRKYLADDVYGLDRLWATRGVGVKVKA